MNNSNSKYEDDLAPLYDITNIVFNNIIEPEINKLYTKYKDSFLLSETSKIEFDTLIKNNCITVYENLSKSYIRYTLGKYFSDKGIAFFIITTLSLKAKLYYSNLG